MSSTLLSAWKGDIRVCKEVGRGLGTWKTYIKPPRNLDGIQGWLASLN